MNNLKLDIINTTFHVEDVQKNSNEYNIICWLEIDCCFNDENITLSMQFDCGSEFDLFCYDDIDDDIDYELVELIRESDCFAILCEEEKAYIADLELSDLESDDDYSEILELSKKINAITEDEKNYLELAKTLYRDDISNVSDFMIFLQINLDINQEQSIKIIKLFNKDL